METVRWAQVALLALASACAHTSSGQVENASSVEATAGLSDEGPRATATADEKTMGTRTRFTYLGSEQVLVAPPRGGQVVADAPTCDPWADEPRERCTFEEAVSQRLR